jgi:hypothetical protein
MDQIRLPDYTTSVQSGDIEIFFKPLNYQQQNQNSIKQFEDQKMLQAIPDADIPEQEKLDLINSALVKLGELSIIAISQSISVVKAGTDMVSDADHIREFVKNCDRKVYNALRDTILNFKEQTTLKPLKVQCNSCARPYETPFTLDVSNFFVQDS